MRQQLRTLTPSEEMRLFGGLVVQPFLASVLAFVSFPVLLLDRAGRTLAGGFPTDQTDAAISVAVGTGIVAFFVTLVCVLPTALWLLKRRQVSLTQALLFGLGFANLPVVFGTVSTGGGYGPEGALRAVAFASLVGLTGAAAFWLISIRGSDFKPGTAAG